MSEATCETHCRVTPSSQHDNRIFLSHLSRQFPLFTASVPNLTNTNNGSQQRMNDAVDWNLTRVLHPAISAHLALFPVIYNKPIIHLDVIVSSACSIT